LKQQTKLLGAQAWETWRTKDILCSIARLQRDWPTAEGILHEQIKFFEETRGQYHCHTLDRKSMLGQMLSVDLSNLKNNANVSENFSKKPGVISSQSPQHLGQ
jgi:hypothetical protein